MYFQLTGSTFDWQTKGSKLSLLSVVYYKHDRKGNSWIMLKLFSCRTVAVARFTSFWFRSRKRTRNGAFSVRVTVRRSRKRTRRHRRLSGRAVVLAHSSGLAPDISRGRRLSLFCWQPTRARRSIEKHLIFFKRIHLLGRLQGLWACKYVAVKKALAT